MPFFDAFSADDSADQSNGFDNFLALASLGSTTFLAQKALDAPRPSTLQVNPNGQMIVSGGGATAPNAGVTFSPWLIVILLGLLGLLFAFSGKK